MKQLEIAKTGNHGGSIDIATQAVMNTNIYSEPFFVKEKCFSTV